MSNFSKKGEKASLRERNKDISARVHAFNKTLMAMNMVYHVLKEDDTVTEDNLKDKIEAISSHKFRDEEIQLLRDDLCK